MREWLLSMLGGVPVEHLDESERNRGALEAEADRERLRRAEAEDALVLERSKPQLTEREQAVIASAHLDAVRSRVGQMVAAHG